MENYRFNKEKHLHEILVDGEWKALTGCTTVLSVLAKPALIQWAANEAVNYIQERLQEFADKNWEKIDVLLNEAKTAHRKKKEVAGDWGTEVHALVEKFAKGLLVDEIKDEKQRQVLDLFIAWAVENKVKFLASEYNVFSREMFTGGILDLLCEIDGKRWIVDIKTSSGIYPEAFAQMAGYDLMLEEMGEGKADGYIVLNLKKDGTFEEKRSVSNDTNKEFFKACLTIYRIQEKIKNQIL